MKAKKLGSRPDTQPSHALSRYVNGSDALTVEIIRVGNRREVYR